MKPSGKPMTRAPLAPASRIRRQAFAVEPSRFRNTEAAWTAATFTTPYASPISWMLLRRLRLRLRLRGLLRLLRPIVRLPLRPLQLLLRSKPRRHRSVGAGQHLMMLDVQGAQPALLAHGERDEIADLDQLRFAEMLVQPCPDLVGRGQVPGDHLRIGQRCLLLVVVACRGLEIDQLHVVVLDRTGFRRLDRALVAAEFAQHRARNIDAAQLLDGMIRDAVPEY